MNPETFGNLIFDKGAKTIQCKKALLTNEAGSTGGHCVEKCKLTNFNLLLQSANPSGSSTSHKFRYTETYRGESGEEPSTHGHRGKVPEQNINGFCSKIKN